MILDDSSEIQKDFLATRAPLKMPQSEDLTTSQKKTPRSHMNPQNHAIIDKSLVLAHNIHKDCPLGVARSCSDDLWCEMVRSTLLQHCAWGARRVILEGLREKVFRQLRISRSQHCDQINQNQIKHFEINV